MRKFGLFLLAVAALAALVLPSKPLRAHPQRKPVRFWHMWTGEWKDVIEGIVTRYNASQSEYEVVPLSIPSGGSTKVLLGIAGGDPPDVMAQWEAVIPTWARRRAILSMEELMSPAEFARVKRESFPAMIRMGSYEGKLYALTPSLNVSAVYLNLAHLEEIGLPADWTPSSMEELSAVGKRLDRRGKDGRLERIGLLLGAWNGIAPVFGGGFYDWEKEEMTLGSDANRRALTFLAEERAHRGAEAVTRFASTFGPDAGARWSFLEGKVSMVVDGAWRVEQMRKVAPGFRYRTVPIPPPKGGKLLAGFTRGNALIVPSGAREPQGALDFIRFWGGITDPEAAAEISAAGGWLPMTRTTARSKAFAKYVRENPQFKTFLDLMESDALEPLPPVTIQNFIGDKMTEAQDRAERGTLTPRQAVDKFVRDVATEEARRKSLGDGD